MLDQASTITIPAPKQNFTEYFSTPVDINFVFANVTPETISETLSVLKSKISCDKDNRDYAKYNISCRSICK